MTVADLIECLKKENPTHHVLLRSLPQGTLFEHCRALGHSTLKNRNTGIEHPVVILSVDKEVTIVQQMENSTKRPEP